MDLDFTIEKYEELCMAIVDASYEPITVSQYITKSKSKPAKFVILRHDVDRNAKDALRMAKSEKAFGLVSTYYFRATYDIFKPDIIKMVSQLGHEVGYHYEVLDKTRGDYIEAIKLFIKELGEFRKIVDVKTICMHGDPLSSYNNLDLWGEFDFKEYGILGDPYLSIDFNKVRYFADTGRTWADKFSIKDAVGSLSSKKFKSTDDLIGLIKKGSVDQMCITAHPYRWSTNFIEWLKEFVIQNIENFGKVFLK